MDMRWIDDHAGRGRRGALSGQRAALQERRTRAVAALALGLAALVLASAAAAAGADAATRHGCATGYVCVYPQNRGWNGDRPSLRFYTYGAHNLSNQFGTHRVYNNQYGGAWTTLCSGYNGTGDGLGLLGAGYSYDFNLTPINSIVLTLFIGGCSSV